jgi:hypothetical protein
VLSKNASVTQLESAAGIVVRYVSMLLVPEQDDPKGTLEIKEQKVASGYSFAAAASKNDG